MAHSSERVDKLARGEDPALICKLDSGFVTLAGNQFLRGYCLLIAYPMVEQLASVSMPSRCQFLADMARVGDAVQQATGCIRVNYAIYGNLDPFLHAHVWPRFEDEPDAVRTLPPLSWPPQIREDPITAFNSELHGDLLSQIRTLLTNTASSG